MKLYMDKSSAVRAAKQAARIALGPVYEAAEGHDYLIYPTTAPFKEWDNRTRAIRGRCDFGERWGFELRGPAANPNDEEKAIAAASWERHRA